MCGRYTLRTAPQGIVTQFELFVPPPIGPRYNIALSQQIGAVTSQLDAACLECSEARRLLD